MESKQAEPQPSRKRKHGAKREPAARRRHTAQRMSAPPPQLNQPVLPEEMMEIVTDAGTFIFDETLSPSISYFLFRPDHKEISETFEQNVLQGEPLGPEMMEALHYIAELRLSDGWDTLMADLFIDRDLVDDEEVQGIVEGALVLLDDIEPGPEGTTLTVYWMQEIGVYSPDSVAYTPPVEVLLRLGEPDGKAWEDYIALGFGLDDIPELIRMAVDNNLQWSDDPLEIYAPVHALRALGQLKAIEAIYPLLLLFDMVDDLEDDYIDVEVPVVFGMIGEPAIVPLVDYIRDVDDLHSIWARVTAVAALGEVGLQNIAVRSRVIEEANRLLDEQFNLSIHKNVDADQLMFNAFIIDILGELVAVESLPLIRKFFDAGAVDEAITGGWAAFEAEFTASDPL